MTPCRFPLMGLSEPDPVVQEGVLHFDLHLLPPSPEEADTVVVIDVLRMTTTAAALFAAGLEELLVVADLEAARHLARREGALLFGERDALPPAGFDGGNSPLRFSGSRVAGRKAVLCTSNGSQAVEVATEARELLLGGIVNASAVAEAALARATAEIRLLCAGTGGRVSFDDVLAAGVVLQALKARAGPAEWSDSCLLALRTLEATPDLHAGLLASRHARLLQERGFGEDVRFAAGKDLCPRVPIRIAGHPPRFAQAHDGA